MGGGSVLGVGGGSVLGVGGAGVLGVGVAGVLGVGGGLVLGVVTYSANVPYILITVLRGYNYFTGTVFLFCTSTAVQVQ